MAKAKLTGNVSDAMLDKVGDEPTATPAKFNKSKAMREMIQANPDLENKQIIVKLLEKYPDKKFTTNEISAQRHKALPGDNSSKEGKDGTNVIDKMKQLKKVLGEEGLIALVKGL